MVRTKKIFSVFFREKPALMLINLLNKNGDMYASALAKSVDCTYSHVVKVLQEMQKAGLVTFERRGRMKVLILTKKGTEIATMMDKINNSF
ncbi:MAG: winged helix DNA-binding protein [Nanoarchaeota archaeon]